MTNGEKYKTPEERAEMFDRFCQSHTICRLCKFRGTENFVRKTRCAFLWLNANDTPSIAEIIVEMRTNQAMEGEDVLYSRRKWQELCDSLDAAAKRAYERIDHEMRGYFHTDSTDVALMRPVMDEVIGGYHV